MSSLLTPDQVKDITGGWDYSALPANVHLGVGCFLERKESFRRYRSRREPGLVLGHRVRVHTWTEFNLEPEGQLEVGDDSVLVGAVFMCAEQIRIGRGVVISYNATIADSDFHPRDPDLRRLDAIANAPGGDRATRPAVVTRPVIIEDGVWIGIGAIVLKGVRIGRNARVGAGAVVVRDVAPEAFVLGNPARAAEDGGGRP